MNIKRDSCWRRIQKPERGTATSAYATACRCLSTYERTETAQGRRLLLTAGADAALQRLQACTAKANAFHIAALYVAKGDDSNAFSNRLEALDEAAAVVARLQVSTEKRSSFLVRPPGKHNSLILLTVISPVSLGLDSSCEWPGLCLVSAETVPCADRARQSRPPAIQC